MYWGSETSQLRASRPRLEYLRKLAFFLRNVCCLQYVNQMRNGPSASRGSAKDPTTPAREYRTFVPYQWTSFVLKISRISEGFAIAVTNTGAACRTFVAVVNSSQPLHDKRCNATAWCADITRTATMYNTISKCVEAVPIITRQS